MVLPVEVQCAFGMLARFPAAGYIAMIGEAMRQITGSMNYQIRYMRLKRGLVVTDQPVEIITALFPSDDDGDGQIS